MPLTPIAGALGTERAAHLLHRTTGGASKAEIEEYSALTAQQAVARLFNENLPEVPLPLDPATGQEWVLSGTIEDVNSGDRELRRYFKAWFLGQMMASDVTPDMKIAWSFRERLVLFLHTHFTTQGEKVNNSRALYFQNALFRKYAFDRFDTQADITDEETGTVTTVDVPLNFKELVKKICIDNAMLKFLDGTLNVRGNPQENYAREMFELYTIGRGLEERVRNMTPGFEGDYFTFTEQDVQAAARVLTGWKFDDEFLDIDQYTGLPKGVANTNQHTTNAADKEFSAYYNNVIIEPDPALLDEEGRPTEESMLDELDKMVTMIFDKEETARHICRKIYRFFVYHSISEEIDDTIIADMAAVFAANNFKLQPVLEELFQSEQFYNGAAGVDDDKQGALIKSPLDLAISTFKFFEINLPAYETNLEDFYMITGEMLGSMQNQGMEFYEPFEVAGYVAYHQFPRYNRNWISTNYLTRRYEFVREIVNADEGMMYIDLLAFVRNNFNNSAPDGRTLITAIAAYLLPRAQNLSFDADGGDLTKERLRYFLQAFLQFGDYQNAAEVEMANAEWTDNYNTPANYLEAGEYLKRLFNAMMQTPEFQLF